MLIWGGECLALKIEQDGGGGWVRHRAQGDTVGLKFWACLGRQTIFPNEYPYLEFYRVPEWDFSISRLHFHDVWRYDETES